MAKSTARPQDNILFTHLQQIAEWWKGFNEQDNSRLPTAFEKMQMMRYPICNAIAQAVALPLLTPKITVTGDEKQKAFVENWFKNYYRRIMALMLDHAVNWGFAVGERIMEAREVKDAGIYWMQRSVICPPSHECKLFFGKDKPQIAGFEWGTYRVNRFADNGELQIPGMVYTTFRGEEISRPCGLSILNDMFWAWQLVMKEWTSWVVYKRMKVPIWVLYFVPEKIKDGTTPTDIAETTAKTTLDDLKNATGITLPLHEERDPSGGIVWRKGWELTAAQMQDREPGYHESIRILNSMMYIVALTPERLFEQFKDTGSQSMVSVQKDFYDENVLAPRMKEQKEFILEWFINPMLEINFGKVDCEIEMVTADRMAELYIEIIREAMRGGQAAGLVDLKEIATRAGIPIDPERIEPELVEAEKKTKAQGVEFETRKEQRKRVEAHIEKWVKNMDRQVQDIKEKAYLRLEKDLHTEQGRIGLTVAKLFDSGLPQPEDVARAVQIPRRVFGDMWNLVLDAWEAGMIPWIDEAKKRIATPYMSAPSRDIEKELWALTIEIEGFECNNTMIAGEGEQLERRIFAALRFGAQTKQDALQIVNDTFNKYVEELLPNRLINLFHAAVTLGSKDALQYLNMRDLERKRK